MGSQWGLMTAWFGEAMLPPVRVPAGRILSGCEGAALMRRLLITLCLLVAGCGTSSESITSSTFNPAVSQVPATATTLRLGAIISQDPEGDPDTQAALRIAETDVNAYLQRAGSDRRVSLSVEGTGYDVDRALAALQKLQAAGIKTVVGPETSSELEALSGPAASAGTVLISHGSTAGRLAIPDDGIFRLVPSDLTQAPVIARLLSDTGAQRVVIAYRDDAFGQGLRDSVSAACAARGLTVLARIAVPIENADYAALGAQIAQAATGANVAVQLSVFGDDAAALFEAAPPALSALRWVGSDGTAKSREILASATASSFAVATGFVNPLFALPDNAKTRRLVQRIGAASGTDVQALAMAAYDAVWLAALTSLQGPGVAAAFPTSADNFFGGTGWTELDPAGDRVGGAYDLWQVVGDAWKATGRVVP